MSRLSPRTLGFILAIPVVALLIVVVTVGVANSQTANGKYDTDGDRRIEISNLEQLDAIRHDLNGDGTPDNESGAEAYFAAFPDDGTGAVCVDCNGYELTRPLDFDDAVS